MSSSVQQFITQVVNKNQIVKSTRLEITLKALICNADAFGKGRGTAIHFLNCLRMLSFTRKAKFYNHFKYESFISVMEKKRIDLDIGIVFKDNHVNKDLKNELKKLTQYIVYCAYLFKDTWLLEPIQRYGVLSLAEVTKCRGLLILKSTEKEAKDLFVNMDLYYLGRLNFLNSRFYSEEELRLSKSFNP